MLKLYLVGMLIIGYFLGVWSATFLHKYCYKKYTDELSTQYKHLMKKKIYGNDSLGFSRLIKGGDKFG